ncbi:MAG: hypothetical protein ABI596_11450 [Pyrinomonadaceae bacterium]
MVTFLITSVFLLGLFAVALYFWQKPANTAPALELPPPPEPRGLFDYDQPLNQLENGDAEVRRKALLDRAGQGDKSALEEAHRSGSVAIYDEVLDSLVAKTESAAQTLSLVSHVTRNELPVNRKLAATLIESWRESPDRNSTAKMLHVAALSNDPEIYDTAVKTVMESWRSGSLSDISATELQAILEGEFWTLTSPARSSGAGFVLKRSLAEARRDLKAFGKD